MRSRLWGVALLFALQSACLTSNENGKTQGIGDRLRPFISIDVATGKRYCQVCAFGGRPTLMAVFDLDDPAASGDLALMQQILQEHQRLTAFALFGRFKDGALRPPADARQAQETLAERAKALGLSFPITVLPDALTPAESLQYQPYQERFDLPQSRTVLLGAADNRVRFADRLSNRKAAARLKRAARDLL